MSVWHHVRVDSNDRLHFACAEGVWGSMVVQLPEPKMAPARILRATDDIVLARVAFDVVGNYITIDFFIEEYKMQKK